MFCSSPQLTHFLESRKKSLNETKSIIKNAEYNAPILSTIVDYGGEERVNDLLRIQPEDAEPRLQNNFQKILMESQTHDSAEEVRNKKNNISFINYKSESNKSRKPQKKSLTLKKPLKTSLVVEMPQQLKQLKNKILNLPSINQSRMLIDKPTNLSMSGSRLLKEIKKFNLKRYSTETQNNDYNGSKINNNKSYLKLLNGIIQQFDSPQIKCNRYILNRHLECKKIIEKQQELMTEYRTFENMGSPPHKIIQLKNLLKTFQKAVEGSMDTQLAHEITHMDNKRYDAILKHEEQLRKLNMIRFQERKKKEKIQQFRNNLSQIQISNNSSIRTNRKARQIYHDGNKIAT